MEKNEELYCELERRIKQKAEAAVAAHKPSEDETAADTKQAEGDTDANAAAATGNKTEDMKSFRSTREISEASTTEKTTRQETYRGRETTKRTDRRWRRRDHDAC